MRVLVLGAYGLIGHGVTRALLASNCSVTGLGRSERTGRRILPDIEWHFTNIASLRRAEDWQPFLEKVDVVVNASGALQRGSRDDVKAVQEGAIIALIDACATSNVARFIQISAPGATADASTEFLRSKAIADQYLKKSNLAWTILRPGLVISSDAYGGTALVRMLAAFPAIQPLVFGNKHIQTVALADVAEITVLAAQGKLPRHSDLDLVENSAHTLKYIVAQFRQWLGVSPAKLQIDLWPRLGFWIARFADGIGYMGWRPPLRTTALKVLKNDIVGDPENVRAILGRDLLSLNDTLDKFPATVQERWFARVYLMLPTMIGTLAFFWLLTGIIALYEFNRSLAAIPSEILPLRVAFIVVVCGSLADIVLGVAVLFRSTAKLACIGMVVLTILYLISGTALTPELWSDPLGPFIKTLPAMVLAAVTALLIDER